MKHFEEKIGFERQVLSIVNRYCSGKFQLTGLTRKAIKEWTVRNPKLASNGGEQSLLELASFYGSLGDLSGHMVDSESVTVIGKDQELARLKNLLSGNS